MPFLVQQRQGRPPQDEGGPCSGGVVGRGMRKSLHDRRETTRFAGGFSLQIQDLRRLGVWCVCVNQPTLPWTVLGDGAVGWPGLAQKSARRSLRFINTGKSATDGDI